jgi:hypothetical protein
MATHGHLKIKSRDGQVRLSTTHSGMDIPQTLGRAIQVLVDYQLPQVQFVLEGRRERNGESIAELVDDMIPRSNLSERLYYAPSVAAMIIAGTPCFLEPTQRGQDIPESYNFTLSISESGWTLRDSDGLELWKCDVGKMFRDMLIEEASNPKGN